MLSGTKLGRYQIVKKIGEGGMGEVYLAHDEQLDRNVALKVLLPEFCCDAERVKRFKLEARAASALNHPSIITIYEVGEEDEKLFIATEYVNGETLREKIEKRELSLLDAIKIAEQVADALAVAHESNIVHRDIKPENIMLRHDGYVKILDFGLAKPIFLSRNVGAEDDTIQLVKTQPGIVMGSVRYMSPEQARGKETDERTDIWSLGVVLYEMLAGTNPFEGETVSDSLAAVIYVEPPPVEDIPEKLQRIISRAVRKNTADRYPNIKEFSADLRELYLKIEHDSAEYNLSRFTKTSAVRQHKTSENATLIHRTLSAENETGARDADLAKTKIYQSKPAPRRSFGRLLPVALLIFAVTLALGAVYLQPKLFSSAAPTFDSIQVSRLTENGNAHRAAISPDGKLIAFISEQNGRQSLMVRQAATGSAVEIVPPGNAQIMQPTFSIDGEHVFYVSADRSLGTLYKISALGGESKKLIEDVDSSVEFSPDGKKLVFVRHNPNEGGDTILIGDSDGANVQPFLQTKEIGYDKIFGLDWSPDNERIIFGVFKSSSDSPRKFQVATAELRDKKFRLINDQNWQGADSFHWLKDNSAVVFLGKQSMSDSVQIWRMSFPDGETKQITTDTSDYASLSLAAETNAIVTTKVDTISSFWSFAPGSKEMNQINGESKTLVAKMGISHSPNGKIYFTRKTGEEINIFSMNEDGSGERQLTSGARFNYEPVAAPDGKTIVFSSNRAGSFNLWRINADGSNPLRLTDFASITDSQIDISPDGQTVYFTRQSSDGGKSVLMKVSINGGEAAPLFPASQMSDLFPRISPNGGKLAYQTFHYDSAQNKFHTGVRVVDLVNKVTKNPETELEFGLNHSMKWTPDGKSLTYINESGIDNIWNLALDSKTEKPLTAFNSGNISSFAWSNDGKKMFIVRAIHNSDLVLIKDGAKI